MNQGKLNSHFSVQLETLKIYHNQGWTISYTDNQSWEWKQFNLNTRERPFTYTRRGLSVLPAANCQSLQIRQLRCPESKQDRCSRCFCHSVRSLQQFLHDLIQESNLPFTFQLQWDYRLQFNKISLSLNSVFCSIKLAHSSAEWTDI